MSSWGVMSARKPRIAWFVSLNPSWAAPRTVSHYAADLLIPRLRDEFEIEVFSHHYCGEYLGCRRSHYLTAFQRHRADPFDLFFYHCADDPRERFIRMHIGLMPGVSWLHDLFIRDLGAEGMHTSPWQHTVRQYLDPSVPFARRTPPPPHVWPGAYRETALSPVVVLPASSLVDEFSQWRHLRVEAFPGAHATEFLPLPVVTDRVQDLPRSRGSMRLALRADARRDGRTFVLFPALERLSRSWTLVWSVSPGERREAERILKEFSLGDRVALRDDVFFNEWRSIVGESDCAFHFGSPSAGNVSPYLEIALAVGCPSVVMDHGRTSSIPSDVAFKIDPGINETAQLRAVIDEICRVDRSALSLRGREYVQREHNVSRVATRLAQIFITSAPLLRGAMDRWTVLQASAVEGLKTDLCEIIDAPIRGVPNASEALVEPWLEELMGGAFR